MIQSTQDEKNKAFTLWYKYYTFQETDQEILPFLKDNLTSYTIGQFSWLKKARTSLFLSSQTMCEKLQISPSTYKNYEKGELTGTITLATLSKIADAMECEIVFAIRPKIKKPFSNSIWQQLAEAAGQHPSLRCYDPCQRPKSIAAIAKRLMDNSKFKKSQGWSQRINQES